MENLRKYECNHNAEIDEKFHQLNLGNISNVLYWWNFFELIKDIPGDIVECGIGRGRSLLVITAINEFLGRKRNIFGYDSFEGFPEPLKEDNSKRNPKAGEWSSSPSGKYKYSEDFIRTVLSEANLSLENYPLELKKGFFGDSLPSHPDSPIALLHVDGDLYQSYKDTLENLYDKVSKGGIIVFDDFLFDENIDESFPGARIATKEFLGDNYKNLKISITGNPYFIKV
ncbi:MAG: TylF/MycF family methyltransferase [Candidatus Muirbacterium halophilum]|jgi:O-methyltransferase|nr:TylF/MycF family methyltransferase [Candidatus Muirbacterium halophilum]MCK9477307.1 TylF/MycF family methyltransferase [Candidatus Muirbacterium halophilum]